MKVDMFVDIFISKFVDISFSMCYIIDTEVNTMANIASAIKDTISISLFNRGLAGKIFEEVKQTGGAVTFDAAVKYQRGG